MDILPSSLDSFHTHGCVPQAPIDRVSVVVSSLKQLFQGHKHKLIAPQVTVAADGSMIVHDGPWVPPIQETHTHNAVLHWPEQKLHWASCPGHGRRKTCFKQRKNQGQQAYNLVSRDAHSQHGMHGTVEVWPIMAYPLRANVHVVSSPSPGEVIYTCTLLRRLCGPASSLANTHTCMNPYPCFTRRRDYP